MALLVLERLHCFFLLLFFTAWFLGLHKHSCSKEKISQHEGPSVRTDSCKGDRKWREVAKAMTAAGELMMSSGATTMLRKRR